MPKIVDHEQRRQELAKATFKLISKSGLPNLTLTKVAKEVGLSLGAIAHYARTREDLLLLAGDYAAALGAQLAQAHLKNYSGIEALRRLLYEALPTTPLRANSWLIWIDFCEGAKKNKKMRGLLVERHKEYQKWFSDRIEEAKNLGEIDSTTDAARMAQSATALVEGISVLILMRGQSFPKRMQKSMIDDWISGMLPPKQ